MLFRSPPLAKIILHLALVASVLYIAPQALPSLSSKLKTLSTQDKFSIIVALSLNGIKGLPFLFVSHSSELTPTCNSSPSSFAALKYSMCPECKGSKPPVTNTMFFI